MTPPHPRPYHWPTEILAGIAGAVPALAILLTFGLLAFSPLGLAAAKQGIPAAFMAAAVSGLVFALISKSVIPTGGPSSATALVYSALVAALASDPAVDLQSPGAASAHLAAITAIVSMAVALAGLGQLVLAVTGLARLAQFVPQPVLAGLMNAVALLILLAQIPVLLGVHAQEWWADPVAAWQHLSWAALLLGLLTAAVVLLVNAKAKRAPASLAGLAVGCLLYALWVALWPGAQLGGVIGAVDVPWPTPFALAPWLDESTLALASRHQTELLTTAAVLSIFGALETMLSALSVDNEMGARHDARRALLATGCANIVGAFFGALPMMFSRIRAVGVRSAGGQTWRAAVVSCLALMVIAVALSAPLAWVPKVVLAGIMLTVAWALIDNWTTQLITQARLPGSAVQARQSLRVVVLVCATTLGAGFGWGAVVGTVCAVVVFVRGMNRSLLRQQTTAEFLPSRRVYSDTDETKLVAVRPSITIFELEGSLFFGSVGRLAKASDELPVSCRFLVLDFRRVHSIDETGAVSLQGISGRLKERRISVLLAGVLPGNMLGRSLRAYACFLDTPRSDWFVDTDRAVEAAEMTLLGVSIDTNHGAAAGVSQGHFVTEEPPSALLRSRLMQGMSPAQAALLAQRMQPVVLRGGEVLFKEGERADSLYVLTEGSISVLMAAAKDAADVQRYVSFSAGAMLGELALIDDSGRSAAAQADVASTLYRLTREDLAALRDSAPEVHSLVYRNIAAHLAQRLRVASASWREREAAAGAVQHRSGLK